MKIEPADPTSPESRQLLAALSQTLQALTGSSGTASFDVSDVQVDRACFVVARQGTGEAVGCGALRPLAPGIAELKRMYAAPGTQGVGLALLTYLEQQARDFGYEQLWLETRRVNEHAVRFYGRHGYVVIDSFGRYVGRPEAVCLGKRLAAP